MYTCKICGKEFESKQKLGGHISAHNRIGKKQARLQTEVKTCKNCGKEVSRRRNKFCSQECFRRYEKKHNYYKGMDITIEELEKYKQMQTVCEICGREETMVIRGNRCSLAADHDHQTNRFRGLLCYSCNTKLSWYENWQDNIKKYLTKNADIT